MRNYNIMPNHRNMKVKITRGELCMLMFACSIIGHGIVKESDASMIWKNLHDKLAEQLEEHDKIYGGI